MRKKSQKINQNLWSKIVCQKYKKMPPKKTAKTAQGAAPTQERKYSSIHVAAETNLVDKLEILLSLGTISIDSIDLEGCTALHRGSQAGSLEAVELLIKHKSNMEARDDRGYTPLMWAAEDCQPKIVECLIKSGCDLNAKEKQVGSNALHLAAQFGDVPTVQVLLDLCQSHRWENNEFSTSPLHLAALNPKIEVLKLIFNNLKFDKECKNDLGMTAVHYSAQQGLVEHVKFLIQNGCEKEPLEKNGRSPLHFAAYNGHKEVVKFLLEQGLDKNLKAKNGDTPADKARKNNHKAIVKMLEK